MFASISPEAAEFVVRNPVEGEAGAGGGEVGEAFPDRALHLVLAFDHESGDRDLFAEIESTGDWRNDHRRLREFVNEWIHDREDPKLEVNFDFHGRGRL